jgi:hypothetical protein
MRPMNEIEIELPQIVLDRADAAYAQIRQQAAQESPAGRRVLRAGESEAFPGQQASC